MQVFYHSAISAGENHLDAEESRHCVKVLRKQAGDTIHLTDGQGSFYTGRILKADPRQCTFEIIEQVKEAQKNYHIHIAIAPTKNLDRTEWFVEKAVELGVDEISFVICDNSERKDLKLDRLERKAISAMKQSLKATLPTLHEAVRFPQFLEKSSAVDEKYIAYVDLENASPPLKSLLQPKRRYCVLVGPEGDFSREEIALALQKGFQPVSLGQSRLRTETAGIAACVMLNLYND
jgi:16S rRNA (uracil1498-N3)-methyltransferase